MVFKNCAGVVMGVVLGVQGCRGAGDRYCSEVDEPKEPELIQLRVENRATATLLLKGRYGCLDPEAMQLKDAAGNPVPTRRTCESDESANSCELGPVHQLVPGASHTISVEAATYREPQCTIENGSGARACLSRVALQSGNYSYSVSWYWASNDGAPTGERHVATLEFAYPVSSELVLLIE